MGIITRRIKHAEIALIKEISIRTAWESFSEDQRRALDEEKWGQHMGELFDRIFKRENSEIFVAENENHFFLGYVWVGEGSNMMTGIKHGFIYDVFVKENYRRKGIGMMLMKRAEHYCREKRYMKMALMVAIDNQPAIKFYIKQDFGAEQMFMGKEL